MKAAPKAAFAAAAFGGAVALGLYFRRRKSRRRLSRAADNAFALASFAAGVLPIVGALLWISSYVSWLILIALTIVTVVFVLPAVLWFLAIALDAATRGF